MKDHPFISGTVVDEGLLVTLSEFSTFKLLSTYNKLELV